MVRRIDALTGKVTRRRRNRATRGRPRSLHIPVQSLFQSLSDAVRGRKESICRAFSIDAHENRMSPGRKGSYCGSAKENTGSVSANRPRII